MSRLHNPEQYLYSVKYPRPKRKSVAQSLPTTNTSYPLPTLSYQISLLWLKDLVHNVCKHLYIYRRGTWSLVSENTDWGCYRTRFSALYCSNLVLQNSNTAWNIDAWPRSVFVEDCDSLTAYLGSPVVCLNMANWLFPQILITHTAQRWILGWR